MYDFDEINLAFNAEQWLSETFGIEFYPTSGGWLMSCCPFEDHEDNSPSFGINHEKGIFNCFGCGKRGSFIKMVSLIQNVAYIQAAQMIAKHCGLEIESMNTMDFKYEKFKKALIEIDNTQLKQKRIIQKATLKVKKHLKESFEEADLMYKKLDELVAADDYKQLREIFT